MPQTPPTPCACCLPPVWFCTVAVLLHSFPSQAACALHGSQAASEPQLEHSLLRASFLQVLLRHTGLRRPSLQVGALLIVQQFALHLPSLGGRFYPRGQRPPLCCLVLIAPTPMALGCCAAQKILAGSPRRRQVPKGDGHQGLRPVPPDRGLLS